MLQPSQRHRFGQRLLFYCVAWLPVITIAPLPRMRRDGEEEGMIRLLQWLWFGYMPKWKVIKEVPVIATDGSEEKWTRYYVQCEQTGKIKMMPRP